MAAEGAWAQGCPQGGSRGQNPEQRSSMRWGTSYGLWGPATLRSFLGFKLLIHPPALIVT